MARNHVNAARRGSRRGLLAVALATLSLLLALVPATSATAHTTSSPRILGKGDPGALNASRLLGQYFAELYGTPVDEWQTCWRVGQGHVLKIPNIAGGLNPPVCRIRQGAPILMEGIATAISNLEPPFSSDANVQRRTARDLDRAAALSLRVSIDGATPVDMRAPRFEVLTEQRTVYLPEGNGLGVEPQVATLAAHGWLGTIRGLSLGLHHILWTVTLDFGGGPEVTSVDQPILVGR
jgi:hypothetical protein